MKKLLHNSLSEMLEMTFDKFTDTKTTTKGPVIRSKKTKKERATKATL